MQKQVAFAVEAFNSVWIMNVNTRLRFVLFRFVFCFSSGRYVQIKQYMSLVPVVLSCGYDNVMDRFSDLPVVSN